MRITLPKFLAGFFILICSITKAQTTTSQDTFHVSGVKTKVTVTPQRYFLYIDEQYLVRVRYSGKYKLGKVELKGGTVEMRDSAYILKADAGVTAILVIYEKLKNGTEQVAYTWTYKLFSRETPNVFLDGVPNDSFADKFAVIALGRVIAKQKYGVDSYQVVSFTMYFQNGDHFDTLRSTSNMMTPEMKQRVDKMDIKRKGGMLLIDDIKAKDPNGKIIDLPPLRIFLQDGDRIKMGL